MKVLLTLVLVVCWMKVAAQVPATSTVYTDAQAPYRLTYPRTWQQQSEGKATTIFYPGGAQRAAVVRVSASAPSDSLRNLSLLVRGQQDSVWRSIQRLPKARIFHLQEQDAGSYQEIRYHYTYASAAPDSGGRTQVVGRRIWRGGVEFRLEYQAAASQSGRYLAEGQLLLDSFAFADAVPSPRYTDQLCDDKMYGIAALRYRNEQWEDDCRTIHEFSTADPSRPPRIHRQALPFQSYALAKGFDNCLYSVTKAPTNTPEYVYRYDPAIRQGRYTSWRLPAQGSGTVWIAAATDERGDLYFSTADASKLVKVSPPDGRVQVLWAADPARQAPYYASIGFVGAGSHGNFCLDEARMLYQIYSTDGSLLRVDLNTRKPAPDLLALTGLPARGGYSDLLFQNDAQGHRRLYLAGPEALYWVDMARRQAYLVRRGIYTDLAGCNLFRAAAPVTATAPSPAPATTWRGRVLDAVTYQPLPQAQLQLSAAGAATTVPLTPQAAFSFPVGAERAYQARVRLAGYLAADSTYLTRSGRYVQDILLEPLVVGATLRLDDVQFEQGKTRLLAASYPALDQLLLILKENPGLTIELRGHTDNVGSPEKNVALSEQRVAAIKIYLVGLGISEKRITGIGLGGAEPRASNAREATRQLNRRVEFRVTGAR